MRAVINRKYTPKFLPTGEAMTEHQNQPTKSTMKTLRSLIGFAVILAVVYFGNVQLQTYLGKQAFDKTGLPEMPLEAALQKAKEQNQLVLADMSAIWCPSCRKLDSEVFADTAVQQEIVSNFIFTRIEYESEEGEAFMKRYNVRGFPTLLLIAPDGSKVRQLPLTYSPKEFIANLRN